MLRPPRGAADAAQGVRSRTGVLDDP